MMMNEEKTLAQNLSAEQKEMSTRLSLFLETTARSHKEYDIEQINGWWCVTEHWGPVVFAQETYDTFDGARLAVIMSKIKEALVKAKDDIDTVLFNTDSAVDRAAASSLGTNIENMLIDLEDLEDLVD